MNKWIISLGYHEVSWFATKREILIKSIEYLILNLRCLWINIQTHTYNSTKRL